jgi:hypothetical protein
MRTIQARDFPHITALFDGYPWNYMPSAVLEGHVGQVLTHAHGSPSFADLVLPAVKLHILGGDPHHPVVADYLKHLPAFSGLMFSGSLWPPVLESALAGRFVSFTRYAFSSESLDVVQLKRLVAALPDGFSVVQTDLALAERLFASRKFGDQVKNYRTADNFVERGFGFCILRGDQIVSSAGTFAHCQAGIEIQIDTDARFRQQGLATAVAAHLILESLKRGLDPSWDAADKRSAHLARKLGYSPQGDYPLYVYVKLRPVMWLRRSLRKIRGKSP